MTTNLVKTVKLDAGAYFDLKEYAIVNGYKLRFLLTEAINEYLKRKKTNDKRSHP
jgi:hypothetical protein